MSSERIPRLVIPRGLIPREKPPTDLFGLSRGSENLVQILSCSPRPGLRRVGHVHSGAPCIEGICVTKSGAFVSRHKMPVDYVAALSTVGSRNGSAFNLAQSHAVFIGAGSVGSQLALGLAQAGIGEITLVDPDVVDSPNLTRTVYRMEDIGRHKVLALAERLASVGTNLGITAIASPLGELPAADLVVASTDDATVQLQTNRAAGIAGTPALFAGCHAGAMSGEILWVRPGVEACYSCTFGRVRGIGPQLRSTPYQAGRRPRPELGLAVDVQRVTSIALPFALALLGDLTRKALLADSDRNLVLVQSGKAPNRRSEAMQLTQPFATSLPQNLRDPQCPHCGREDESFLDTQRATVRKLQNTAGIERFPARVD